jgi:RNA polymerase-binding protein DksA
LFIILKFMENQVIDQVTIDSINTSLLAERDRLVNELENYSRKDYHESDQRGAKFPEYGDKPDENAQEISEYTATIAEERLLEDSLDDVEGALKRIEAGTYGICKYCQKPINSKRLLARPTASSCIECKTELQQNA